MAISILQEKKVFDLNRNVVVNKEHDCEYHFVDESDKMKKVISRWVNMKNSKAVETNILNIEKNIYVVIYVDFLEYYLDKQGFETDGRYSFQMNHLVRQFIDSVERCIRKIIRDNKLDIVKYSYSITARNIFFVYNREDVDKLRRHIINMHYNNMCYSDKDVDVIDVLSNMKSGVYTADELPVIPFSVVDNIFGREIPIIESVSDDKVIFIKHNFDAHIELVKKQMGLIDEEEDEEDIEQ